MIKTLGKHIKGYTAASILTPVGMLGEVIVENFIPLLMATIIDSIGTGDLAEIYKTAGIMPVSYTHLHTGRRYGDRRRKCSR